tara:strand:- start:53 stop:670 length:618 start_codon:yes stop_codon:yes gene_type:complete
MTKYKKLDPNGRSAECWYIFIDKGILDKNDIPYESLNSDLLKKLPKNKYIEYVSPSYLGEILFTNEYSNGDIYCSKSDVIDELFISINNGNLEIDNNLFKNFEDILKITNYTSKKVQIGDINISSEKLVCLNYYTSEFFVVNVHNGNHSLYELFDDTYIENIGNEKKLINKFTKNDSSEEWHKWNQFVPKIPNIHFLYFDFKQNK